MILITPMTRIDSCCLALALAFEPSLFAIAIARAATSFASSPLARLTGQRGRFTHNGLPNEKTLRFSKARRNPYAKRLKKQVTIRIDEQTLGYFKALGERVGMPYQTLINMYLRDCAETRKELRFQWRPSNDAA